MVCSRLSLASHTNLPFQSQTSKLFFFLYINTVPRAVVLLMDPIYPLFPLSEMNEMDIHNNVELVIGVIFILIPCRHLINVNILSL